MTPQSSEPIGPIADAALLPDGLGLIRAWAGDPKVTPAGWLPCDGRAVSRKKYAALFGLAGESFGSGDGATTFNVPKLTTRDYILIIKY